MTVSEAANLRCGDLKLGYAESKIFVRDGKGSVSGHVMVPDSLKKHLKSFLSWKENIGEPIGDDDHFFSGNGDHGQAKPFSRLSKNI
jgi:integrase/recombinase XerD